MIDPLPALVTHPPDPPPLVVGTDRKRSIGDSFRVKTEMMATGATQGQPIVIVRPSTYEAWLASYRFYIGEEPTASEKAFAQSAGVSFYEAVTD